MNPERDPRPVDPPLPKCATCRVRFEPGDVTVADAVTDALSHVDCCDDYHDEDFEGAAI